MPQDSNHGIFQQIPDMDSYFAAANAAQKLKRRAQYKNFQSKKECYSKHTTSVCYHAIVFSVSLIKEEKKNILYFLILTLRMLLPHGVATSQFRI